MDYSEYTKLKRATERIKELEAEVERLNTILDIINLLTNGINRDS